MNIRINSNFKFRIVGIAYTCNGEMSVTLFSEDSPGLVLKPYKMQIVEKNFAKFSPFFVFLHSNCKGLQNART